MRVISTPDIAGLQFSTSNQERERERESEISRNPSSLIGSLAGVAADAINAIYNPIGKSRFPRYE